MESKQKQIQLRHKAAVEQKLQDRLSFLSAKGIVAAKTPKDTIARKLKAELKAINNRLRLMAEHDKRTEEMAKVKAERAAAPKVQEAPKKEKESAKAEKGKKAAEQVKEKKVKPEKKAAPPKAPEA